MENRPNEAEEVLREGEEEPVRVVVFNMVDEAFGGKDEKKMIVRRMDVRREAYGVLKGIEEDESHHDNKDQKRRAIIQSYTFAVLPMDFLVFIFVPTHRT